MCIIRGVQHKTILNDLKLELVEIVEPLKMPKKCFENTAHNYFGIRKLSSKPVPDEHTNN